MTPTGPDDELEGRVAVVTGAGGGIGRAVALRLARAGAIVVVADRRLAAAEQTAADITAAGGQAQPMSVDVVDGSAVASMFDVTVTRWGALDILVNNAGVVTEPSPLASFDEDDFDRLVAVNFKGVFLGLRHGLPHMIEQGRGVVVNVASVSAIRNVRNLGPYAATKHAVVALTRAAATEVGEHGVRVNALLPGPTNTPLVVGREGAETGAGDEFAGQVPLGRISQPEEQAEAALFLVSDRAGFISGSSLLVDGAMAYVD
ncbi:MAG: short-chain dehydrogenase [Nocardioides sp.]|nr:short-chain dehydrogenase [Nocardioides sp.]